MSNGDKGHGLFSAPKFKDQIFDTIMKPLLPWLISGRNIKLLKRRNMINFEVENNFVDKTL